MNDPIILEERTAGVPGAPIQPIRIALVDDNHGVHLAIREVFKAFVPEWLLDSYLSGNEAIVRIPKNLPNAVLMDITMPEITGIECTKRIKTMLPNLPVIMFTAKSDTESLISSIIAGASGYLIKPVTAVSVVSALKKSLEGLPALCPETEMVVVHWLKAVGKNVSSWKLTAKEQQIMIHVCSNHTDKEIASLLGIYPGTVHAHLVSIFKKLNVHNRNDAKRKFSGFA